MILENQNGLRFWICFEFRFCFFGDLYIYIFCLILRSKTRLYIYRTFNSEYKSTVVVVFLGLFFFVWCVTISCREESKQSLSSSVPFDNETFVLSVRLSLLVLNDRCLRVRPQLSLWYSVVTVWRSPKHVWSNSQFLRLLRINPPRGGKGFQEWHCDTFNIFLGEDQGRPSSLSIVKTLCWSERQEVFRMGVSFNKRVSDWLVPFPLLVKV